LCISLQQLVVQNLIKYADERWLLSRIIWVVESMGYYFGAIFKKERICSFSSGREQDLN